MPRVELLPEKTEAKAETETSNAEVEQPKKQVQEKATKARVNAAASSESSTIRVETAKIDGLINLVGELVITQSILKLANNLAEGQLAETLENAIDELNRNTRDIQESVMSMRMLPISFVFNRFPRVIRDLSTKLDKEIKLEVEGGETEIDKGMIEKQVDPLTHLVRNSLIKLR